MKNGLSKILFPVDFSPFTDKMMERAGELAAAGMKEMVLLHVIDSKPYADYGDFISAAIPKIERTAEEKPGKLEEGLGDLGISARTIPKVGDPAQTIVETAKGENVSLIYMGGHGKGFINRFLLGSVTEKVLRLSDRPVLVQQYRIRGEGEEVALENACSRLLENVLIASDFSNYAEKIKLVIIKFATSLCAPVTLLHVKEGRSTWGWDTVHRENRRKAKENMRKMQDLAPSLRPACGEVRTEMVTGNPATWILRTAAEINASPIMVGAFGHRTTGSLLRQ
ncbi:MAG: universal stress protein [Actinomycetota bacterium]